GFSSATARWHNQGDKFGRADRLRTALPDPSARGGDVDVAVGSLEHAGRNAGWMVVAGLPGDVLFHQPARGLKIQHEDLRLQQRSLPPLTYARDLALQKSRENPVGAEQPGREVRHRDADPHRSLARRAGDRQQPAHALRDLIEAGALVIGAILAEAGDAAVDDARIDLVQALVIDAEPRFHIGAEVFDHDVGLLHETPEHFEAPGILQVKRHRALVAV